MTHNLISSNKISLCFGENVILNSIDFTICEQEIVTLIGPNGGGKTSLLRLLLGLIKPTTGKITRTKNLRIGYVPQKINFDPTLPLSVKRFLKVNKKFKENNLQNELLGEKYLKIEHLYEKQLDSLSGGQMQRVLLARALSCNPNLLVMDEPDQGLDSNGQIELYEMLLKIKNFNNCAILMVSHDLHMVMASTDKVICLNGHICCQGTPAIVSKNDNYLELFGEKARNNLAFYSHHHNHRH